MHPVPIRHFEMTIALFYPAGSSPPAASAAAAAGGTPQAPPSTEFYFYQSADGQCVFLHPLVSRALLAHYGSYAACPPEVRHAT